MSLLQQRLYVNLLLKFRNGILDFGEATIKTIDLQMDQSWIHENGMDIERDGAAPPRIVLHDLAYSKYKTLLLDFG